MLSLIQDHREEADFRERLAQRISEHLTGDHAQSERILSYLIAQSAELFGQQDLALSVYEERLRIARSEGRRLEELRLLGLVVKLSEDLGDSRRQEAASGQALELSRRLGDRVMTARMLASLGRLAHRDQKLPQAAAAFKEAIGLFRELRLRSDLEQTLKSLAKVARAEGQASHAERLDDEAGRIGQPSSATTTTGGMVDASRPTSGIPLDQVVAEVAARPEPPDQPDGPRLPSSSHGLTPRQLEVLRPVWGGAVPRADR